MIERETSIKTASLRFLFMLAIGDCVRFTEVGESGKASVVESTSHTDVHGTHASGVLQMGTHALACFSLLLCTPEACVPSGGVRTEIL